MTISGKAVEAAAKVLYAELGGIISPDVARQVLEAAAPHMLAEAWDEGAQDGQWNAEHIFQTDAGARHAIENPYRS